MVEHASETTRSLFKWQINGDESNTELTLLTKQKHGQYLLKFDLEILRDLVLTFYTAHLSNFLAVELHF